MEEFRSQINDYTTNQVLPERKHETFSDSYNLLKKIHLINEEGYLIAELSSFMTSKFQKIDNLVQSYNFQYEVWIEMNKFVNFVEQVNKCKYTKEGLSIKH